MQIHGKKGDTIIPATIHLIGSQQFQSEQGQVVNSFLRETSSSV